MARTSSRRLMSLPPATLSTLPPASRAFTTALPGSPGPSGIPEVPSSGLPSPPTSPPLAALTASNELALLPKKKPASRHAAVPGRPLMTTDNVQGGRRRGGAGIKIREECERFFCAPMKAVFLGERNPPMHGHGLTGAFDNDDNNCNYNNNYDNNHGRPHHHMLPTPPQDVHYPMTEADAVKAPAAESTAGGFEVDVWMELWDYAGGASFRAFIASGAGEKTLFVFFDAQGVMGRDLKKALMALIELADGPLGCAHVVTCLDRRIPADETLELTRSLQWVGFEMTTLDHWAGDLDVTSDRWMFMGMEI